jgi:integrase
LNPRPPT